MEEYHEELFSDCCGASLLSFIEEPICSHCLAHCDAVVE